MAQSVQKYYTETASKPASDSVHHRLGGQLRPEGRYHCHAAQYILEKRGDCQMARTNSAHLNGQ